MDRQRWAGPTQQPNGRGLPSPSPVVPATYDSGRSQPDEGGSTEAARYDFQNRPLRMRGVGSPLDWEKGVACLRQQRRPPGIPEHRWKLFVAHCITVHRPRYRGAQRAAEVGWSTGSPFGFRYQRPIDHLGSSGLLWDLAGGTIMQVLRNTMTIVLGMGSCVFSVGVPLGRRQYCHGTDRKP